MEANYARMSGRPCTLDYSTFETVSTCDEKLVAHDSYCASIAACLAPTPSPPPATPPTPPDVGINAGRGAPAVAPSENPSNDFFDDECGEGRRLIDGRKRDRRGVCVCVRSGSVCACVPVV